MSRVDARKFFEDAKKIEQRIINNGDRAVRSAARAVVDEAKKKAPEFTDELKRSSFVRVPGQRGRTFTATFGFKARHAQVMDTGFNKRFIRPIRAKALFIPKTRRAARIRARGGLSRNSGLKIGIDFNLVRGRVRTAGKGRVGRRKGPNRFMTATVARFTKNRVGRNSIRGRIITTLDALLKAL